MNWFDNNPVSSTLSNKPLSRGFVVWYWFICRREDGEMIYASEADCKSLTHKSPDCKSGLAGIFNYNKKIKISRLNYHFRNLISNL